jgi:hypothetical protein
VTPPFEVNFTALDSRFSSTWRTRPASPTTRTGASASTMVLQAQVLGGRLRLQHGHGLAQQLRPGRTPPCAAPGPPPPAWRSPARCRSPRAGPGRRRAPARRGAGPRSDRPRLSVSSRVKPMMLFSGVRSSWLILARKSALERHGRLGVQTGLTARASSWTFWAVTSRMHVQDSRSARRSPRRASARDCSPPRPSRRPVVLAHAPADTLSTGLTFQQPGLKARGAQVVSSGWLIGLGRMADDPLFGLA